MTPNEYMLAKQSNADQLWEKLTDHEAADNFLYLRDKIRRKKKLTDDEREVVIGIVEMTVTEILLRLHRKETGQ